MEQAEILDRISETISGIFGRPIEFSRATTAKDVPDWDSLRHVLIIAGVEEAFNIQFSSTEMDSLQTVGDFVDLIGRKLAEPSPHRPPP